MAKKKKANRVDLKASSASSSKLVSVLDDPPRKNAFLLTCMDQRLLDETVSFMNALNMHNRYDQLAIAGASMGIVQMPSGDETLPEAWWPIFKAHLSSAINMLDRQISDVFLIDHLDCGAYKELHPDTGIRAAYKTATLADMHGYHETELDTLAGWVRTFCNEQAVANAANSKLADLWRDIRISKFIIDLRGKVFQLDVPPAEQSTYEP